MHDYYLDDFKYFYLAGDDAHLIVENLRNYLGSEEEEQGMNATLFVGQLHPAKKAIRYFVTGGGGYVLNRLTLKRLVNEVLPTCFPFQRSSQEDVFVTRCLKQMGVSGTDAADAKDAQRFHSTDADFVEECPCPGPFNRYWKLVYEF